MVRYYTASRPVPDGRGVVKLLDGDGDEAEVVVVEPADQEALIDRDIAAR
jgi:hypothetical protein